MVQRESDNQDRNGVPSGSRRALLHDIGHEDEDLAGIVAPAAGAKTTKGRGR